MSDIAVDERCFIKICCKNFRKTQMKTLKPESLFNKFLKKNLKKKNLKKICKVQCIAATNFCQIIVKLAYNLKKMQQLIIEIFVALKHKLLFLMLNFAAYFGILVYQIRFIHFFNEKKKSGLFLNDSCHDKNPVFYVCQQSLHVIFNRNILS